MLTVRIETSTPGRLWAPERWKGLSDALARGGAKHDPRKKYPDLATAVELLVEERSGRFFPRAGTALCADDDTAVRMVLVKRVAAGNESVSLETGTPPDVSGWSSRSFPFFGTIGDSKYEAQSKLNREALAPVFFPPRGAGSLGLAFQLSCERRDRDVDNLADALMPFFNRRISRLHELVLVKLERVPGGMETLRFSCPLAPQTR